LDDPGIGLAGERVRQPAEHLFYIEMSGAPLTILENRGETVFYKTPISHLTVPITAAGLQGEQPLVDETMWVREVGKMDP